MGKTHNEKSLISKYLTYVICCHEMNANEMKPKQDRTLSSLPGDIYHL